MSDTAWEVRERVKDAIAALNAELKTAAQHRVVTQMQLTVKDGVTQIVPTVLAVRG